MQKKALITGITGQDGSYLALLLLDKGYDVHAMRLYTATDDCERLTALQEQQNFLLYHGDLTDGGNICGLLSEIQPDEIYNLGAQSHVKVSFDVPEATANINALGTLRILEAMRHLNLQGKTKFYQASSSEMFGKSPAPQNENTPFAPCSPYATSKCAAYWYVRNYRESYGFHASNGILFNHESPVRGEEFVTRKITKAVAMIEAGQQDILAVGNINARRDWGHAADYVDGMWRMLQQEKSGDYVLATGKAYSVRDFIETAFAMTGTQIEWQGIGLEEQGVDQKTGRVLVKVDPQFFRPNEVHELIGDASKAQKILGWSPSYDFKSLVKEMVEHDRMALNNSDTHDILSAA